ncbi:MAG TPA: rod shape-determining protein MreC [Candidatus Coprenecus stercoravium]|uniref:Cell shape-determining protein MreC n=1 Tax=Candidatus Coprenecus stercoravium TaxID=2840735 RepID=A0A9D2GQ11_9BACT|nr:rod shape-determining protein MreC [Candidatus Coprenecus stercoravium]
MNNRKAYIIYIINAVVFIALEAVSLTMVSNNSIVQRSEIMKAVSAVTGAVSGAAGSVTGYFSLGRVNDRLSGENVALRMENDRLRAALSSMSVPDSISPVPAPFRYIPATIVSNSTDRLHNIIIINKGRKDGVAEDMGVITDRGIVGYILSAGERYSKVSSMLDIDNMASATHRSTNTFGVLQWDGASPRRIILHDIPVHTELSDGDTVVSSGYSLIYPAGIPIGTVSSKELRDGVNYDLSIDLFENFSSLRHVYVAVREDIDSLKALIDGEEAVRP